ncbi:MAG TPA: hypothetical protein VMP01_26255 [Pirellulaceae bacterium]|nr:hypothetical protein [Pirellulaceae bacterium]
MARNAPTLCALVAGSLLLLAGQAAAIQPSETLLPNTTKGYAATPDIEELRSKFKETQFGELVRDEAMKEFIEDLRIQLREKLNNAGARLGLTWEDLEGVPAGEVAIAAIQPDAKDRDSHATAILVDITSKRAQADALLAKMDKNLLAQRAVKSSDKAGAINLTIYTLPAREVERLVGRERVMVKVIDVVVHFIQDDQLVVTDHKAIAQGIAGRFGKDAADTLAKLPAFEHVAARLAKDQGKLAPQVRWFLEPFGYTEVSRAMAGGKRKRGMDLLAVLRKQGFTAIQGLGGHVFLATGAEELLHRSFVYAPTSATDLTQGKWELAMRMLDFPNSNKLAPPAWVSQDVGTYVTFHNKLQNSFWYAETLIDEYMGDKGVFKDMIDNLKIDPAGPMIDIKRELVDHLGERVIVISDVEVPVTTKSERLIVAIEITNPAVVAKTLQKNFSADPKAKKREIGGHIIWEVANEETSDPELTIEGDDGGFVAARAKEEVVQAEPILPNMAFTVFKGQLMVATHVDFLADLMANADKIKPLDGSAEYKRVDTALIRLGAANDALRSFTRTDKSYRGTYDLVRQGKLPQAETILARVLNNVLGSGKKEDVRQQEIDGSKLPPFEQVQKYLGPAGAYLHTEENGWILVGCLLKKEKAD